MKKKINNLIKLLLIFLVFFACNKSKSDNYNKLNLIELRVFSPYNCNYIFLINENHLVVSSETTIYDLTSTIPKPLETIKIKYDTILELSTVKSLEGLLAVIEKNEINLDTTKTSSDAFYFELFIDNRIVKSQKALDKEIYKTLELIRPYLDSPKIQCDDFFRYLEEFQH